MSSLPGSHTVFEASGFVMQCFWSSDFWAGRMDGFNQKSCNSFDRGLEMLNGQSDVDMAEVDREIEVTRLIGPFWCFLLSYHILKPNTGPGFKGCHSCSSGTTWRCWWCRPPPKQWRPGKIIIENQTRPYEQTLQGNLYDRMYFQSCWVLRVCSAGLVRGSLLKLFSRYMRFHFLQVFCIQQHEQLGTLYPDLDMVVWIETPH